MTPQERDVIAGIFDRLKQAVNQPRDPEAERFIAERLRDQPYAPYAMAQAVYVQEQALTNLQAQVEDLQAQLRDLQNRPAEAPAGGFLSGIFGGAPQQPRPRSVPSFPQRSEQAPSGAWNTQPGAAMQAVPAPQQPQAASPWANAAAAQQQPGRAGGGFMATALTTAAGVAGGMMLGNVLSNAFSGGKGGEAAKAAEAGTPSSLADSVTADNAAKGSQPANDSTAYDDGSSDPASYQQAAHQEPIDEGYDDGSSFDDDSWT